jgi:hypothetical protein
MIGQSGAATRVIDRFIAIQVAFVSLGVARTRSRRRE